MTGAIDSNTASKQYADATYFDVIDREPSPVAQVKAPEEKPAPPRDASNPKLPIGVKSGDVVVVAKKPS